MYVPCPSNGSSKQRSACRSSHASSKCQQQARGAALSLALSQLMLLNAHQQQRRQSAVGAVLFAMTEVAADRQRKREEL